jgi:Dolichyl-phosphate-mannose-protein mannosyltransferase
MIPTRSANTLSHLLCAMLLAIFACLAWFSVREKSPTFDEPYHSMAGWVQLWQHDFRLDPENPPLWKYWAALLDGPHSLAADFQSPLWTTIPSLRTVSWEWVDQTLYRTVGNDPDAFIGRQKIMMLLLGVALGAGMIYWAGRIAGPIAMIVAAVLYCFDPNFLAYSPLVKNDVVFALTVLGLSFAAWRAGQRLTISRLVMLGLWTSAAITVKFTGILVGPILLTILTARALLPQPWPALNRIAVSMRQRFTVAAATALITTIISYGCIWTTYDFRFAPTPNPTVQLDMKIMSDLVARAMIYRAGAVDEPTAQQIAQFPPTLPLRAALWAEQHQLLPQAFLNGLLYTYQSTILDNGYLLEKLSQTGRWYYFPLAILFKTPLATLAAIGLAIIPALRRKFISLQSVWTLLCVTLGPAICLTAAMASNVNVGLRHILCIYPCLFILIGWSAATAWERWPRRHRIGSIIATVLALGLAIESLSAFPDYIPFFNVAAGGSRGGLALLGDSNLDWGQDLKLLANWQQHHPQTPLYLSYFGVADPGHYGIRYINLPGGYSYGPKPTWPTQPGIIAISASNLQGIWLPPNLYHDFYSQFRRMKPLTVLGGSIYLFNPYSLPMPNN